MIRDVDLMKKTLPLIFETEAFRNGPARKCFLNPKLTDAAVLEVCLEEEFPEVQTLWVFQLRKSKGVYIAVSFESYSFCHDHGSGFVFSDLCIAGFDEREALDSLIEMILRVVSKHTHGRLDEAREILREKLLLEHILVAESEENGKIPGWLRTAAEKIYSLGEKEVARRGHAGKFRASVITKDGINVSKVVEGGRADETFWTNR